MITTKKNTTVRLGLLVAAAALVLTGCSAPAAPAADDTAAADAISISDAWVKAAGDGMSAAFGAVSNSADDDITVVSATTEAAGMVELHETVENEAGEMVMREIDGGFVIPAGGSLELEPGGNHIMLMGLTGPLRAGDEVTVTLTFSDDSTFAFTAPVKDYSGANENYQGSDDGEMDH